MRNERGTQVGARRRMPLPASIACRTRAAGTPAGAAGLAAGLTGLKILAALTGLTGRTGLMGRVGLIRVIALMGLLARCADLNFFFGGGAFFIEANSFFPRPRDCFRGPSDHDTSKMHSISTAMLPGKEPMPTALRAPTPASSPKTSAINSETPLITSG